MKTIHDVKAAFDLADQKIQSVVKAFPWESKEAYLSWMSQSLEYVLYTTRILALTGGNFPLQHTKLASRFIQHATEEKGHDKLLFRDAEALGTDLHSVPRTPEAEAFHKSVYFWIHHNQPAVIMGWVIFLEGFAVRNGGKIYERAEKAHGKKATSFLKVHTQEDPEHLEAAFSSLGSFSPAELADVVHGIELYSKLYANILNGIAAEISCARAA